MEHLVLPHAHSMESSSVLHVDVSSMGNLRTDERMGEIMSDGKEAKVEDGTIRNYRPEDFLMLLPQEQGGSGDYAAQPNPFQSACTMCPNCKRVLVFPANAEAAIQCPACKKLVDVDSLAESKLLRTCPQCDTLLGTDFASGNPSNAPKVLCPLCMKLIEWSVPAKELPSSPQSEDSQKGKKRPRKSREPPQPVVVGTSADGTPILASPKKKGYIKKGEPGYVRPKYTYVKKGQPGYVRPKYNYVKKGDPGHSDKPKTSRKRKSLDGDVRSETNSLVGDISDEAAAALLGQAMDGETVNEGIVREIVKSQ